MLEFQEFIHRSISGFIWIFEGPLEALEALTLNIQKINVHNDFNKY